MRKIIDSCNIWLAKKREVYMPQSRPDLSAVRDYLLQEVLRSLEDPEISSAVERFAADWNMHVGDADAVTITLLDIQPSVPAVPTADTSEAVLQIGTWVAEGFRSRALIRVECDRETGVPVCVKLVGTPADNMLWDIVEHALWQQEHQGGQVMDRWTAAPYRMRRARPICPQCGSTLVRCMDFGQGNTRLGCDSCYWAAVDSEMQLPEELAEKEAFLSERRHVIATQEQEQQLNDCVMAVSKSVSQLEQVLAARESGAVLNDQVGHRLQEDVAVLERLLRRYRICGRQR